jgi:hypothetical protein
VRDSSMTLSLNPAAAFVFGVHRHDSNAAAPL